MDSLSSRRIKARPKKTPFGHGASCSTLIGESMRWTLCLRFTFDCKTEPLLANLLLNLNHASRLPSLNLRHSRHNLPRERKDRLGMRRILALEHDRLPAVSRLAHLRVKLDAPEESYAEVLRHLLRPTTREDIDLMIAMRTREITHILDHAHQ